MMRIADIARETSLPKAEIARRIGTSRQNAIQWDKVPAEWVLKLETATGIRRERIRPDLYPPRKRNSK